MLPCKSMVKARIGFLLLLTLGISGCMPMGFNIFKPDDSKLEVMFYPGGNSLDDLLIIDGKNYFGKGSYQYDDALGDIGFRFKSGERVRAECISTRKDIIGNDECALYEVYRSNFALIPEGSEIPRPQLY